MLEYYCNAENWDVIFSQHEIQSLGEYTYYNYIEPFVYIWLNQTLEKYQSIHIRNFKKELNVRFECDKKGKDIFKQQYILQ